MRSESPGKLSSDNVLLGCDTNQESKAASRLHSFSEFPKESFSQRISVLFCSFSVVLVLFLELAFRLQPVVQVAAVNPASLDVALKGSLPDFRGRRSTVL